MADVAVELDEAARVEELLQPLAGEQLPALALALDRALVAGVERLLAQPLERRQLRLGGLEVSAFAMRGAYFGSARNRHIPSHTGALFLVTVAAEGGQRPAPPRARVN